MLSVVTDYIRRYAAELTELTFEPEKSFETLIEYGDGDGGVLVSGAIDVVRSDDPPRVRLIDFKSGDPDTDKHQALVACTAAQIRKREFKKGPAQAKGAQCRCAGCDFLGFCGMPEARRQKQGSAAKW